MGELTLREFGEKLRFSLDARSDLTKPQLNQWVEWAYQYVSHPTFFEHTELLFTRSDTLVTGQAVYDLSFNTLAVEVAGIRFVHIIEPTGSQPRHVRLDQATEQELLSLNEIEGQPTKWARDGEDLRVWPEPSSDYNGWTLRVAYWAAPRPIADENSGVNTAYPPEGNSPEGNKTRLRRVWDEVILMVARWRALSEMRAPRDEITLAKRDWQEMLQTLRDSERLEAESWGSAFQLRMIPYQSDGRG